MDIEAFITRWTAREGGAERANYQMFLSELCDVLGVPRPDPAGSEREHNDYVFERAVRPRESEGGRRRDASTSTGRTPSSWRPSNRACPARTKAIPLPAVAARRAAGALGRRGVAAAGT